MNPIEQVNGYLKDLERRLRWSAITRGAALLTAGALLATLALVAWSNSQAFSDASVRVSRVLLFIVVALAVAFGLVLPLLSLNRRRAARRAEERIPEFRQRLLTYSERSAVNDPFSEILAADTLEIAAAADTSRVADTRWMAASASAAAISFGVLMWLILAGPGFLGHGASLLWAGAPRAGASAAFYDILIEPGNRTVRRNSDQPVKAQTVGFQAERATLFAKYRSASKWEPVPMLREPGGAAHEFVFAGLPDTVEYYVTANGVRSRTHTLAVVDLPAVKKLRVTYAYPSWVGVKNAVEDPGGDLRAVAGTTATVEVLTDKPLSNGLLVLDDGTRIALKGGDGNWLRAEVPIKKHGTYHVAALHENKEDVRLTEDYFIEAQNEEPPTVKIARPGRDAKVLPIEEVTIAVDARDDFGLQEVAVQYSVNGGPEKKVSIAAGKGAKEADGQTLIALEDFKLQPGDIVSVYATARDARTTTRSDITFIETQPYEREYTQSQLMGGGGGGGGGEMDEGQITQRQKEIIAATFNQIRDRIKDKSKIEDNAKYLSEVQGKLAAQAKTMAERMKARQLAGSNQEFQSFTKEMEAASSEMVKAADKLKAAAWTDAMPFEQKGLQHLSRADALRRQIQIAYSRGGGGGGGGGGRDLENMFDLELDREKNTYETGESAASQQRQQQVDETLQRLEQLARRQQELAKQAQQQQQGPQQKWQQEMLRREAEKLQEQMRQLAQQQQGGQSQAGSQGQRGGQSGQQSAVNQAMSELSRATQDMRSGNSADARRAADRLREAVDQLRNLRQQESGNSLDDLSRRAEQLAQGQRDFANKARQPGQTAQGLGAEKEQLAEQLKSLERDMQRAARDMAGSQRGASSKLREALGDSQGFELQQKMRTLSEWYKRGLGQYAAPREGMITQALDHLNQQLGEARQALGSGGNDPKTKGMQQALNQLERLREQLAAAGRQQGQRGQQNGQQPGQGQQGNQPGQQQGQNAQQPGQGQQGGQQPGNQQGQGGQQGGDQPGGQQGQRGGGYVGNGGASGDNSYGVRDIYRGQAVPQQGLIAGGGDGRLAVERALRQLSEIRLGAQEVSPDAVRELERMAREMQRLNQAGNPRVLEQVRGELLPQIEQLEIKLRRELEGDQGQNVRAGGTERVAPAYRDAVAEYYRRLSKVK